ncbi:MAG: hypothetical protein DRP09_19380 [Candidatus Thorarchaeota archaeon]|nr:MAG: hypothetical protein DRP09_19380 [Candidatus Thorarchaeota archaeon]
MTIYRKLAGCTGFQWDKHNVEKNWEKHNVTPAESEEVFFNRPLIIHKDMKHSEHEDRYYRYVSQFVSFFYLTLRLQWVQWRQRGLREPGGRPRAPLPRRASLTLCTRRTDYGTERRETRKAPQASYG